MNWIIQCTVTSTQLTITITNLCINTIYQWYCVSIQYINDIFVAGVTNQNLKGIRSENESLDLLFWSQVTKFKKLDKSWIALQQIE